MRASVVVAHRLSGCGSPALEPRLNSCRERAQLPLGMWDLPGPGIKSVFPALACSFFTAKPPGKPQMIPMSLLGLKITILDHTLGNHLFMYSKDNPECLQGIMNCIHAKSIQRSPGKSRPRFSMCTMV